jgi:hypothetical protein
MLNYTTNRKRQNTSFYGSILIKTVKYKLNTKTVFELANMIDSNSILNLVDRI